MATINYERYDYDNDTTTNYLVEYNYSKGDDGDYDTPPMLPEVTLLSVKKDGLEVYLKYDLYEEICDYILNSEKQDYDYKEDYHD